LLYLDLLDCRQNLTRLVLRCEVKAGVN